MGEFKKFLEFNVAGDLTNPEKTAKLWWQGMPSQNYIDENLVRRISEGISNPKANDIIQ